MSVIIISTSGKRREERASTRTRQHYLTRVYVDLSTVTNIFHSKKALTACPHSYVCAYLTSENQAYVVKDTARFYHNLCVFRKRNSRETQGLCFLQS